MGASATWLPAAWSPRPLLAPPGRPLPQLARVGWRRWLIAAGIVYSLTVAFSSGGVLPTSRVRGGSSVADWLPGGAAGRAGRRSLQEQAAAQQRGGSAVAAAMAMEGWPTDGRKYVTFLVCKVSGRGNGGQAHGGLCSGSAMAGGQAVTDSTPHRGLEGVPCVCHYSPGMRCIIRAWQRSSSKGRGRLF